MASPVKPDIGYSYSGFQQEQQDFPFPGTQLDNDLAELKRGTDDTIDALADVRRSDGALVNEIVTLDSLNPEVQRLVGADAEQAADRAEAYAALAGAKAAPMHFIMVAALIADSMLSYTAGLDKVVVSSNDLVQAQGFDYKVAAAAAADHHITTAGGVKLYVQLTASGMINPVAFGADKTGTNLCDAAIAASLAYLTALGGGVLQFPPGVFNTAVNHNVGSNIKVRGASRQATRIDGLDQSHAGFTLVGSYSSISDLNPYRMSIGIAGSATARFCKVFNNNILSNRIGIDWVDGFINSVYGNDIMFNTYGMCARGASYEFNVYDNVIDNNLGGLGILISGTPGINLLNNTIEGNRIVATGYGAGLILCGSPQRVNINGNWFESNGTIGGLPSAYSVDALMGDGVSALGAEIADKCVPAEYKSLVTATASLIGTVNFRENFFLNSGEMIHLRLQAAKGKIYIADNHFNVDAVTAVKPVNIINAGSTQANLVVIERNFLSNPSGGAVTPSSGGIGNSYVYCDAATTYGVVMMDGIDLYTKRMTLAQFDAMTGSTLDCQARLPASGNASFYRDVKLSQGTAGVRTAEGTGRLRLGAAGVMTVAADQYAMVLSDPGGRYAYVNSGSALSPTYSTLADAANLFTITRVNAPANSEVTLYSGEYYGYAVISAADYATTFGGRTRLQITDWDTVSVRDKVAAKPSSASQLVVQGDIFWNSAPAAGGVPAWMAVVTGPIGVGSVVDFGVLGT